MESILKCMEEQRKSKEKVQIKKGEGNQNSEMTEKQHTVNTLQKQQKKYLNHEVKWEILLNSKKKRLKQSSM